MATGKYDSPLPTPDVSSYNSNMDYHLNTIKDTLDFIHGSRTNPLETEKIDGLIHDLTKVVRLIKGLKK